MSTDGMKSILNVSDETASSAVNSARNLINSVNSSVKTPISLLQEICTKCHIKPVYEAIATEGHTHVPIFVYKVTVGDIDSIGKGTSKKRAKHAAALAVLNEIKNRSIGKNNQLAIQIGNLIKMLTDLEVKDGSTVEEKPDTKDLNEQICEQKFNPVGELLELTQKYSIRPPIFEYGPEEGPPHNREFVCHITFGEFKECGNGRSKKHAKRAASIKLLHKIKSINQIKDNDNCTELTPNSQIFNQRENRRSNKNLQSSFVLFKHSDKPLIKELLANNLPFDELSELNCKLLDELSQEQNFEICYVKTPAISKSGQHQVLLQLRLLPVTVVHGAGSTLEDAQRQAAYNALLYIKLLSSN